MKNLSNDTNWTTLESMLHQEQYLRQGGTSQITVDLIDETTPSKTPEQKLKEALTEAVKNYSSFITTITAKNKQWGTTDTYSIDLYMNWLNTRQLDRIFDPDNDSYTFCDFVNILVKTIKQNPSLSNKSVFVKSKLVYKPINIKDYITTTLKLDKNNEIHKLFIDLVTKFVTYYNNQEQSSKQLTPEDRAKQIHSLFNEAELYLKQELLEENPAITKLNFTENSIDNLIKWHIYHTDNVEHPKQLLALVKLVIDNNDTLQDIPDLTADSNWHKIICDWYDIATEEEPVTEEQFNDLDENELPTFSYDIFDYERNAEEYRLDAIRRERIAGSSKGGSASKSNHVAPITIINIHTQERHTFDTSDACAKFLNISKRSMVMFKQGTTKLNKIWQVV